MSQEEGAAGPKRPPSMHESEDWHQPQAEPSARQAEQEEEPEEQGIGSQINSLVQK